MSVAVGAPAPLLRARTAEWPLALLVAGLSLAVYVRTMYPDMLVDGGGDTPKFQYLGRLLGTAHNPGYPFHIVVSYLFSYVPIGTVAYRMNLLSGVAGALSVAAMYFVMRRLACGRAVAALMAMTFGLGRVYWGQAIAAEVYTMAALLLAGFVAALFRWGRASVGSEDAGRGRRWRDLMIAVGIAALAVGHHTSIALVVPGAIAYALLVDHRQALQPKTLAVGLLLIACGLAQYGFIVVRTLQRAPHVESHAASLGELVAVIRGAQFESQFLAHGVGDAARGRAAVVAGIGFREVGTAGALLLAIGVLAMVRRCPRELVFLLCGIALDALFVLTYGAPDTAVFMVPAFVLAWPIAACGLEMIVRGGGRRRSWRTAALIVAALLLPGGQLRANYRANDHHLRYIDGRELRAILAQLPDRTAIVGESYSVDAAVTYALEVEHIGRAKRIAQIPRDGAVIREHLARGYAVYAFGESRKVLEETAGLTLAPVPVVVPDGRRFKASEREVFRVIAARLCSDVGNVGWTEVTEIARRSGGRLAFRIDNVNPFDSVAVVYAESARLLRPLLVPTGGPGQPRLGVGRFDDPREIADLSGAMARAGQGGAVVAPTGGVASRIEVDVNDRGDFSSFVLRFEDAPSRAWVNVTIDRNSPRRATVCEEPRPDVSVAGHPRSGP